MSSNKRSSETGQVRKEDYDRMRVGGGQSGTWEPVPDEVMQKRRRITTSDPSGGGSEKDGKSSKQFAGINLSANPLGNAFANAPATATGGGFKFSGGFGASNESPKAAEPFSFGAQAPTKKTAVTFGVAPTPPPSRASSTNNEDRGEELFWRGKEEELGKQLIRFFVKLPEDSASDLRKQASSHLATSSLIYGHIRQAIVKQGSPAPSPVAAAAPTFPPPRPSGSSSSLGGYSGYVTSASSAYNTSTGNDLKSSDVAGSDKGSDVGGVDKSGSAEPGEDKNDTVREVSDPDWKTVNEFAPIVMYYFDEKKDEPGETGGWKKVTKKNKLLVQKSKSGNGSHRMVVRSDLGTVVLINMMISKGMTFEFTTQKSKTGEVGKVTFMGLNDKEKGHQKFLVRSSVDVAKQVESKLTELASQAS